MVEWPTFILTAVLFVAYANGANDNFKGVATLFGSGAVSYRTALGWATMTTLAGSLTALFVAGRLVSTFQGKGLVPAALSESEPFVAAVVSGAALTIMLATTIGLPISTTHSLTGALCGAAWMVVGWDLGFDALAGSILLPLILSPLCALAIASLGPLLLNRAIDGSGLDRETCLCVQKAAPSVATPDGVLFVESAPGLSVIVDRKAVCAEAQASTIFGIDGDKLIDAGHFVSAGLVGFARGLNDTPKIVALSLLAGSFDLRLSVLMVAMAMAAGGLLNAKKVALTMSRKITGMERDCGLWANLVTSGLVLGASGWGVPVSTTHVSCGALFGIGIANGEARWRMIRTILLAWLLTLPAAALLSAGVYLSIDEL